MSEQQDAGRGALADECHHCGKPRALCVCEGITPIENRIELLVLQHPQEQDRELGTARLAVRHFSNATLKIGLSWPGLGKLLGRVVDPQRWAVLYLGSARPAAFTPAYDVAVVGKNGEPEPDQESALRFIEGIILLDGTWSQAKTLWWRNPWMLRCRRIVLNPSRRSGYGSLRREPRREGLATIEAAAMLLARLEHRPEIETVVDTTFERMLARYREIYPKATPARMRRPKYRHRR